MSQQEIQSNNINDLTIDNHNHDGINSQKVLLDNSSGVILTTGDQTKSGILTLEDIPVLPASDPTTDNQAVRKAYIDGLVEVIASDTVVDQAVTDRNTTNAAYTKLKDITYNEQDGTIRVIFQLRTSNVAESCFGRIYVNGAAVGTEREWASTDWSTDYTEDISVNEGDEVQLYTHSGGTHEAHCRNFQLGYDKVLVITDGTVNTN